MPNGKGKERGQNTKILHLIHLHPTKRNLLTKKTTWEGVWGMRKSSPLASGLRGRRIGHCDGCPGPRPEFPLANSRTCIVFGTVFLPVLQLSDLDTVSHTFQGVSVGGEACYNGLNIFIPESHFERLSHERIGQVSSQLLLGYQVKHGS